MFLRKWGQINIIFQREIPRIAYKNTLKVFYICYSVAFEKCENLQKMDLPLLCVGARCAGAGGAAGHPSHLHQLHHGVL
jgi:hypothetical protein